jgi:hypothetical protein
MFGVPRGRGSKHTRKRPAPRVPAIYVKNGVVLELSWASEPLSPYGDPNLVSRYASGEREKKDENAHLYMSLVEFPLYIVLVPSIEGGLNTGDGGILVSISGCFILNIHDEWSTGVEAVEGGRAGELWGKLNRFVGKLYPRRHHPARQSLTETCGAYHQRSISEDNSKAGPHTQCTVYRGHITYYSCHPIASSYWSLSRRDGPGWHRVMDSPRSSPYSHTSTKILPIRT